MNKSIILVFLLGISILAIPPYRDIYSKEIIPTPKEYISLYARQYGAVESELLKVASCESKFKIDAIHWNDGGKSKHSFGIFQYQKSTFDRFDDLIGEDLDYYSYHDQIKLTAFVFAKYPELKSHWTCSRIMGVI